MQLPAVESKQRSANKRSPALPVVVDGRSFQIFGRSVSKLAAAGASHITPPCAARRARPSNVVLSAMRGDIVSLEALPHWLDLDEQQSVFRFFVSSTFDDPSARYIASCSHDMSVHIWDAVRYEEVATLTGHTEEVRCISWDRSGRYVASGAGIDRTPCFDTTIRVWDAHARKNVTALTGCKYNVNTVSFDCTGR
jgi:WD40 repeat protein